MNIPEFQRRKLASSVVGTAGVDTSGQQIAQSVTTLAGNVADVAGKLAIQRSEAKDKAVSFDTSLSYESDLQKLAIEHQQQYATFDGDPITRADLFREKASALRDTYASGMQSDKAKQAFLQTSGGTLNSAYKSELSLASANQVAIGAERVLSANNKISNTAYGLFSNPDISLENKMGTLSHLEAKRVQNANNSVALLGVEEATKLNKSSREGLVKASLLGLMENTPADAVKFLKEKGVKEALGAEEYDQWTDKVKKRAMDFKSIQKERQYKQVFETNRGDIEKFERGEHNLASIQAIKDDTTRNLLQNSYLDAHSLTPGEIMDVQADYVSQWDDFWVKDKTTGKLTAEVKKEKKYEDVVRIQQLAMRNFRVTQSTSSLVQLSKELPDILAQVVEHQEPHPKTRAVIEAMNAFIPTAMAFATGKGDKVKAEARERSQMATEFFKKLADVNVEDPVAVQNAIKSTILAHQSRKNSNRARYLIGESIPTPRGAGKVVSYRDDGEPILEFDK